MKKFKLTAILIALASVISFTSCLDTDSPSVHYASYTSYVTLTGNNPYDYEFHSDLGYQITPTTASIEETLKGLSTSKAKRILIGFDMADGTTPTLEAGKNYNVILRPFNNGYYLMNYIIVPTYSTIDTAGNHIALDSLTTQNKCINMVDGDIWAANGYVNARINLNYNNSKKFYLNTYFNSEEDVDTKNNTLYLNLYYNDKADYTTNTGADVFSFELPKSLNTMFTSESINIVLRAKTSMVPDEFKEVGRCTMKQTYR